MKKTIMIMWLITSLAYATDFDEILRLAKEGDARAQANLGAHYSLSGEYEKAFKWYKKSAQQGNALGQNNLGAMYQNGYFITKNTKEAFKWYMKSAQQGDERGRTAEEAEAQTST